MRRFYPLILIPAGLLLLFGGFIYDVMFAGIPYQDPTPEISARYALHARISDALEWLAAMCSHIPNRGEQMVRYYGYYSNVSRGKRKKKNQDELIPSILEPYESSKQYRKNWARLIQKIYEADPLLCPRCQGRMKPICFIEDPEVIKKILEHLRLWSAKSKPPPRANAPPAYIHLDYSDSQIPSFENDVHRDPDYPIEIYPS